MSVVRSPSSLKIPSFPQSSAACHSSRILCQNNLSLLPQFINLISNIPIFLFAICQLQNLLVQLFQSTVNLCNLLLTFVFPAPTGYSAPKRTRVYPSPILSESPLPPHPTNPILEWLVYHITLVHAPHGYNTAKL